MLFIRATVSVIVATACCVAPGLAESVWACPAVPERPACLPEMGTFDDLDEAHGCAPAVKKYVEQLQRRMACEKSATDRAHDNEEMTLVKSDFVAAMQGVGGSGGVPTPPAPPAPAGSAPNGGNGMAVNTGNGTTNQQVPIIVNVGGGSLTNVLGTGH